MDPQPGSHEAGPCPNVPPMSVDKSGDVVWARLDEKQTHFFNTRTGESLQIKL